MYLPNKGLVEMKPIATLTLKAGDRIELILPYECGEERCVVRVREFGNLHIEKGVKNDGV